MSDDPAANDDRLARALADAVPDRRAVAVTDAGPSWNEANRTVRVAFADGDRAYLKYARDGAGDRVERERAALAFVGAARPVRVPRVLSAAPDAPVPHLATAPLAGQPLHGAFDAADGPRRAALARAVGRTLAAVHGPGRDTHGHVVGGGADGLAVETAPWTDVLRDLVDRAERLAPSDRLGGHYDRVARAVERHRDLLDGAPAAVVHGDPAQPNCVVAGTVGLVDWEGCHVGDPARDLYRARDQQTAGADDPNRVAAALDAGYREVQGSLPDGLAARRPVYAAVRQLGRSGYVERWAAHRDEPVDRVAREFDAAMERRLDRLS